MSKAGFQMRHVLFAILFTAAAARPAVAADGDGRPAVVARPASPAHARTGKERLSDKASDEQRVDDCKVPVERRTQDRPVSCPWDVGS